MDIWDLKFMALQGRWSNREDTEEMKAWKVGDSLSEKKMIKVLKLWAKLA